ncbi:MAG TPA: hypothetical protein VJU61_16770 [Polyangiaceae bacterium]|nr:hypothetical protein [Polyangiaceae bacterium]
MIDEAPLVYVVSILLAALYAYSVGSLAIRLMLGKLMNVRWREISFGAVRVLRFRRGETDWKIGLLPVGSFLSPATELASTGIAVEPREVWQHNEARNAAESYAVQKNLKRLEPLSAAGHLLTACVMVLVSLALAGVEVCLEQMLRHPLDLVNVWPPWSRGAAAVNAAVAALSALPPAVALGVVFARQAVVDAFGGVLNLIASATPSVRVSHARLVVQFVLLPLLSIAWLWALVVSFG